MPIPEARGATSANAAAPTRARGQTLAFHPGGRDKVVDRPGKDGPVRRSLSDTDRRTVLVALTPAGLAQFAVPAAGHEAQCPAALPICQGPIRMR